MNFLVYFSSENNHIVGMTKIELAWRIFQPILWPHIKPLLILAAFIAAALHLPTLFPQYEALMVEWSWLFALAGFWLAHEVYSRTD